MAGREWPWLNRGEGRRWAGPLVCSAGTPLPRPTAACPCGRARGAQRQALMAFQRSLSKLLILPVWCGKEATSSR